jgi:hypothetical protein
MAKPGTEFEGVGGRTGKDLESGAVRHFSVSLPFMGRHPGNANIGLCISEKNFAPQSVVLFNPQTLTLRPCGLTLGLKPSPGPRN